MADICLADRLFAPHYARAMDCGVLDAVMMRSAASSDAPAVSQLLPGETFELLDSAGGWSWGRSRHDGYVGYIDTGMLGPPIVATHRVHVPSTLLFARPDIKAPVLGTVPIGALLAGTLEGAFLALDDGFVHARHVQPVDAPPVDPVAVAERLLGQPYLWGGRGDGGIDCSGLVQLALSFAGIPAPRDSDQQRALGEELAADEPLRRGDLVCFPGHIGLMASATDLVHANAFWMAVTVEPLADVVARLAADHAEPVLTRRRLTA